MKTRLYLLTNIVLCFFFLNALSCVSVERPKGESARLLGMVYDWENKPVSGYRILVNGGRLAVTDINGRFSFDGIRFGEVTLAGESATHIPHDQRLQFDDRNTIVYLRVPSNDHVYLLVDSMIAERKYADAKKNLSFLGEGETKTSRYHLYNAIIDWRTYSGPDRDNLLERIERIHWRIQDE